MVVIPSYCIYQSREHNSLLPEMQLASMAEVGIEPLSVTLSMEIPPFIPRRHSPFACQLHIHRLCPYKNTNPPNDIGGKDDYDDDDKEERIAVWLLDFSMVLMTTISHPMSENIDESNLSKKSNGSERVYRVSIVDIYQEEPNCEHNADQQQTSLGTRSEISTLDQKQPMTEEHILQLRCSFILYTFTRPATVYYYMTVRLSSNCYISYVYMIFNASAPRKADCYSYCYSQMDKHIQIEESQPLPNSLIEPTGHLSEVAQPTSAERPCNASTYATATAKVERRRRNYLTPGKILAILTANNIFSKRVIDVDQFHQQHVNAKNWESEIADAKKAVDIDELEEALPDMDPRNWRPTGQHLWIYTVPRYPDNHNPLLPLLLQQQLDEMNPREFLTYVLKELTLEERESLMVDEKQRRKTFLANWPLANNLSGIAMAKVGFYCLDDYDRVQCVFCRGCLHRWEADDIPLTEHAKSFNFCRFVKGLECGNREYRSNMLSEDDIRNVTRYCSIGDSTEQRGHYNQDGVADSGLLGISTNRAAAIQNAPHASRMKTFSRWSPSCSISSQKMCDAGFYYTGFDDQVRCFFCAGGIRDWGDNDDPWEEHAKWFPDCAFLLQQKGEAYVVEVHARTPSNNKCSRKTQSQKKAEIKKVEHKSEQESMKMICEKLGHRSDVIDRAVGDNGRPFDNISDMINAIYDVEEDDTERPISGENQSLEIPSTNQSYVVCPEDDRRNLLKQNSISIPITPGQFDGSEHEQKFKMGCRNCELKTATFVPATRVGLPCGHLIYCESCNAEELKKSEQSGSASRCPYPRCSAPLTGSIRVYFA